MGVEPLIALPPRVLVAGRLQCGAARAGVFDPPPLRGTLCRYTPDYYPPSYRGSGEESGEPLFPLDRAMHGVWCRHNPQSEKLYTYGIETNKKDD